MKSSSMGGTNSSGFSALPGGLRYNVNGYFDFEGNLGYWWSSSADGTGNAWYRNLASGYDYVGRYDNYRRSGFSVRCVRDK